MTSTNITTYLENLTNKIENFSDCREFRIVEWREIRHYQECLGIVQRIGKNVKDGNAVVCRVLNEDGSDKRTADVYLRGLLRNYFDRNARAIGQAYGIQHVSAWLRKVNLVHLSSRAAHVIAHRCDNTVLAVSGVP